ncbi:MAG: hypothetical protein GY711_02435 [bacterium]|nr:hypothetical protein [bacterium]
MEAATLALALTLPGAASPPQSGDALLTKSGRIVTGRDLVREEGAILVRFESGDVRVPNASVLEVFLEDEFSGTPEEAHAQRDRIAGGVEHAEWGNRYEGRTRHFEWHYTIPRPVCESLQERAEKFLTGLRAQWSVRPDSKKSAPAINLHHDLHQLRRMSGASDTSGYFMFLGSYDICLYFNQRDQRATEKVLFVLVTYYAQMLLHDRFRLPEWPRESLAHYYAGTRWDERAGELQWGGTLEERWIALQEDVAIHGPRSVAEIVTKPDSQWGWALVSFLMGHEDYKEGFQSYVRGLAQDRTVERIRASFNLKTVELAENWRYFRERLELQDPGSLEALQQEFYTFVRAQKPKSAQGFEKAALIARAEGRPVRAKQLFGKAEQAGGLSALGCHELGQLLRRHGEEAGDAAKVKSLYERAVELAPLDGEYWYRLGESTVDEEEAERLRALAKEMGFAAGG